MTLRTVLFALALLTGLGCSNAEPNNAGRGSSALTGEVPSSSPEYEDWQWDIYDADDGSIALAFTEVGYDDELLAIECDDFDGDGDLELALETATSASLLDVGETVDLSALGSLAELSLIQGDLEALVGLSSLEDEIASVAATATSAADAAAALSSVGVCELDPQTAVEVCVASFAFAASCSGTPDACANDITASVTSAACISALSGLIDGAAACAATLQSVVDGYEVPEIPEIPEIPEP